MTIVLQFLAAMTIAAPLAFFLWRKRHRLSPVTLVLCGMALLLALPQPASAAEIVRKERYTLPAEETLNNDLIIMAGPVRIEGTVDGDVIAFCESLTIEGHVTGDLIVFTRRLTVNGAVDGSVRTFANTIDIGGKVNRSFMAFGEGLELRQGSEVGWGALLFGKTVDVAGRVGRDVTVHADRTGLAGWVGGAFLADAGHLSIASTAEVLGKATYRGREEPTIEPGAKLASFEKVLPDHRPAYYSWRFYWDTLLGYASVLALGAVIMLISPPAFRAVTREARRPGALIGAVVLLAVPVAAVICAITLVGFAIFLVSSGLWLILLYVAQVFVGGAIGEILLGPSRANRTAQLGRLAVGLAIIRVASALRYILLPGAGPWLIFWLIVASWGFGAITLAIYERARWKPSVSQPPAPQPAL